MKQLFLVAALAMGAAGCADDLRPIQILGAQPLDEGCAPQDVGLYAGSLDLAALDNGETPATFGYLINFTAASQLQAEDVEVGGSPVSNSARNNFIMEEIEYTFESTPARAIPAERIPAYGIIPVGGEASINILLTPPRALQAMKELVDSTGTPATLLTKFRIKGKLASGTETESNEASFPITVFNSGIVCADPTPLLARTGPCGGPSGVDKPITCTAPGAAPQP